MTTPTNNAAIVRFVNPPPPVLLYTLDEVFEHIDVLSTDATVLADWYAALNTAFDLLGKTAPVSIFHKTMFRYVKETPSIVTLRVINVDKKARPGDSLAMAKIHLFSNFSNAEHFGSIVKVSHVIKKPEYKWDSQWLPIFETKLANVSQCKRDTAENLLYDLMLPA
jgi:hypothetical protein